MLVIPTHLSLIVTHHCTAACEHCCFSCSPQVPKSTRIPRARISSLIEETADITSMRVVAFTGGECFTLGLELDEHVAHASRLGKVTRTVTNGYWASTAANAERRLNAIADAGLQEINFSSGTFHGRYVPYQRVKHGVKAAVKRGLRTVLNVEICDQTEDVSQLVDDPEILQWAAEGKIVFNRNPWIVSDGNLALSHPPEWSRFEPSRMTGCTTVLTTLTVTPAQDLVACCGLHLEKIPELHLGSIADRPIRELLQSLPDDLLKVWIHLDGPEVILTLAQQINPAIQLPLSSTHMCESCLFLYRDKEARQTILDLVAAKRSSIISRYTDRLANMIKDLNIGETARSDAPQAMSDAAM